MLRASKSICKLQRFYTSGVQRVVAIRREDNSVWERRAPLAPHHVKQLIRNGVKVLVQPSNRRAYNMAEYAAIGAKIQEDISEAPVIIGVKVVPIDALQPNKTYVFFSHTIKAQEANMPLLDAILEKNIRLIDYEKMVDNQEKRVVAFGKYAGVSGMINILHGMGLRLLALGHHTPFMHIGPSHNYRNSGMASQAIRDAGYEISLGRMPQSIGPLTFVFTGSGNVSQGAQEIFQDLPHEYVEPEHLPKVAKHGSTKKVYGCVVSREDHLFNKETKKFVAEEFEQHPELYASNFALNIAPYASCIINGIYYAPNSPRLISIPDAKNLLQPQLQPWLPTSPGCPQLPHRLLAICDISADPGGSIEFMKECTTIDAPFCLYDADQNMETERFFGDGVLICSIDNMPAQIPREATDFFGSLLLPYIPDLINSDAIKPFEEMEASPVVKNAVITSNGSLTPNFEYIKKLREQKSAQAKTQTMARSSVKKVLILGAGYVSAPVVDYLTRDTRISVTVAAQIKEEIDKLAQNYPNTEPVLLELHRSQQEVEDLIKEHDLVISLLPYALHPQIAKLCIKYRTNMVTASYCSPAMQELHADARDAGITVMNEVGVDPGIDHMLAMECFDEVKLHGGKINSFISYCGGLPAPENSENPLRYKFSWSPRGVLYNIISTAKYLMNSKIVEIEGDGGLLKACKSMDFLPGFHLEGFPNRDSLPYSKMYNIESAHTILRGTLRYRGFSESAEGLLKVGLINPDPHPKLHPGGPDITWREFLSELVKKPNDILTDSLRDYVFDELGRSYPKLQVLEELGLFDDELIDKKGSPLDTLSYYLSKKLAYAPGERDMIVMRHDVGIQLADGKEENRHIDFVVYGDPKGYTAMAATVGFPTGIAAKMIIDAEIQTKGMVLPFSSDIYRPILQRLKTEGFEAREKSVIKK